MPTPNPFAPGILRGTRVVVDAFNADLKQGSGIATYSRTLISTLEGAGADVGLLYGRNAPNSRDPLIGEVSFYAAEEPTKRGRLAELARQTSLFVAALNPLPRRAHRVPRGDVVMLGNAQPLPPEAYNTPRAVEVAELRHKICGRFTSIRLDDAADVVHLTYPWPIKVSAKKAVVTIHDLIPLRLPYTTLENKRDFIRRLRTTTDTADLIITVSESSKRDLIELLKAPADKIAVTYQASDFSPLSEQACSHTAAVLDRFGLASGAYALFVGAIEPKKNLRRLLRAYLESGLREPLAVVGRRAWLWREEVEEARAWKARHGSSPILFLDYVSRDDLHHLYAGARALLFPSLYEGFGLPCLEAMQLGVPVLTSRTSSLPEVCGEAAVYVDPFDVRDIHDKLKAIMSDSGMRAELSNAGLAQAQKFTADRYRGRLLEAYQRLA